MNRRTLVQRVGGMAMAGGLIAGMSLFAMGSEPYKLGPLATTQNADVTIPNQVHDLSPAATTSSGGVPRCTKSVKLYQDPMGTMGSALDCTGAPRVVCSNAI